VVLPTVVSLSSDVVISVETACLEHVSGMFILHQVFIGRYDWIVNMRAEPQAVAAVIVVVVVTIIIINV
jgi:hypothetical protein